LPRWISIRPSTPWIRFLTGGYRFLGSNATYQLKDGAYATAGVTYIATMKASFGAAYDWRQRLVNGSDDSSDVMGCLCRTTPPIAGTWSAMSSGLTMGSRTMVLVDY